jgi:hypothetical protein
MNCIERYSLVQLVGMHSINDLMSSMDTAMRSCRGAGATSTPSDVIYPQVAAANPQETESWFRNRSGWSTMSWRVRLCARSGHVEIQRQRNFAKSCIKGDTN